MILAYAIEDLLPRVDQLVDRENRNTNKHFNNPTATVTAAWFMEKWQWHNDVTENSLARWFSSPASSTRNWVGLTLKTTSCLPQTRS